MAATTGLSSLTRRKSVDQTLAATEQEGFRLRRNLGALDVVVLGVGVMVGAGIFVLTGQAAATEAGPAITLSFVVAAVGCALAALCYAEFASMVPAAGSAYTYAYATLGELAAFIIGWDLVLEFTIGSAAVAVGWSGYINSLLDQVFGVALPDAIAAPPGEGGVINLPAILLILALGALLVRGIKLTAKANIVLVGITVATLLLVVGLGASEVDTANWDPYFPFGFAGVMGGAGLVFFAFIGFDVVATSAEETERPQRDMPRGIIGSLLVVTLLYVAVAAVITGMVAYEALAGEAPVADAFETLDKPWAAAIVYGGALIAITNTVMILMLGQTRVAFAMARDRLLPRGLARTHARFRTPHRFTLVVTVVVALLAALVPLADLAELVNIGTLFAFAVVSVGVIYLRYRGDPDRERPFRVPLMPVIPIASVVVAVWLMTTLGGGTWLRFGLWMGLGLVVYALYSRHRSALAQANGDAADQNA